MHSVPNEEKKRNIIIAHCILFALCIMCGGKSFKTKRYYEIMQNAYSGVINNNNK